MRFRRFRWAYFARFSLLVGWTVCFCGYVGFLLWLFVGFALTAVGSTVLADTVMENRIINSLNRTNAFLQYGSAQPKRLNRLFWLIQLWKTRSLAAQTARTPFTIWFCSTYLVKWTCTGQNWHHFAVSGNQKTCVKATQTASFFHPIMKNVRNKPNKTD